MRILLINPSLHQATTGQYEDEVEKERGVYPPLGLAYIAAILENKNHEVKIIDCDVTENYRQEITKIFQEFGPRVVGFYAMTWNYHLASQIAKEIKELNPEVITILGGPNMTCMPGASLKFGQFDFGVISEGEVTIGELIDKLENKNNLEFGQILGLAFKQNGEVVINPARPLINSLDDLPYPARHLLPMEKYFDVFSKHKKFATIIATRGCPFNCTFCDRKNRMGRGWRVRSPKNIAEEIKGIIDKYGIREFMFFDDNLIIDKKWANELFARLKNLNIIWECRERVDMVDESTLRAMKDSGCYRIRFGFESGDNRILKILKKDITVEQSLKCAELCKKIGIEIVGYFIIGAPQETNESIKNTINLALKINPSFALFSKMILIPGSELFNYAVATKQITSDYWIKFINGQENNGAPTLTGEILAEKIIDDYIKTADRKFNFRLSFILRKLMEVRSFGHLMSQAKIGLALIFKTK